MTSSKGFQLHFYIISKFVCCGCYMKKNADFAPISFAVLKWHECLSFQLLFELTVEISNLLVHNVIEREIEREKVQMKPPKEPVQKCGKKLKNNNLAPEYSLTPALHHAARSNCGGKVIKRSSGRKNRRKSPPYLSIKSIKNAGKKML